MFIFKACSPDNIGTIKIYLNNSLEIEYTYTGSEKGEKSDITFSERIYKFKDENGVEFKVTSGLYGGDYIGKSNFCDYAEVLFLMDKENVDRIYDGKISVKWSEKFCECRITIANYADLETVTPFIAEMLEAVPPFPIKRPDNKIPNDLSFGGMPNIEVYYENDGQTTYFKRNNFICVNEKLPTQEEILTDLQNEFADSVKLGQIDEEIPDDVLTRQPISKITEIYLNGININKGDFPYYTMHYHPEMNDYMVSFLDPCQDFDGSPYGNFRSGAFASLVRLLGGTYSSDNWKAEWTIGEDKWSAELFTKRANGNKYNFEDIKIFKNGEPIELSELPNKSIEYCNNTVSGRKYTLADLEKMLGITATYDNKEAVIRLEK